MGTAQPGGRRLLAGTGELLRDPSRINILYALMDGSARPAGELARMASVAPATASAHLRKLLEGGFVAVWSQGRHRYFRLAGAEVAAALEALTPAPAPALRAVTPPTDPTTRRARVCYDHVAGLLGVALYERVCADAGWLLAADAVHLREKGRALLVEAGLAEVDDPGSLAAGRACVDWTERHFHLSGPLGAWLAGRLFEADWLRRRPGARALTVTATGRAGLSRLGLHREDLRPPSRGDLRGAPRATRSA